MYGDEGLTVRTKPRKRLASRPRVPMPPATRPNEHWSMDFVSARTTDGRWFRTLTVLDHGHRRCDGDQPPERDDTEQLQHLPQSRPTARPAARASKW
jgi:transposase InsO family protein